MKEETQYYAGQRFNCYVIICGQKTLKIMAIADKHIMCRYTGCTPFVKSVKEFPKFLESIKATEHSLNKKP